MTGTPGIGGGDLAAPDPGEGARPKPKKAPTAFRTISEVADELHIPQHVLRFWETKFPQLKPLKRGGGRRYYRPEDIQLLRRVSDLLYIQGYTIKGVQRLLREGGGLLADDIPPATESERAAAQEELAMPLPPEPMEVEPVRVKVVADDSARLRLMLSDALAELEAVRALLSRSG